MNACPPTTLRWGSEIINGTVNGHPCRLYAKRPGSLAELLLDAQRWSTRPFIVQGMRRITVTEHWHAVLKVAKELQGKGVKRGDNILLLGYNHIEWLVAFWAVQCVGATAVLGNAWWSDMETADAINLTNPTLIITDRPEDRPLRADVLRIQFDALRPFVEQETDISDVELEPVDENDAAVVIFSSGTTGQAKGVVMSHRSIIANIQNLLSLTGRLPSDLPSDHPGTVSLVSMPLFHLAGLQISLMTMLSGGRIVFLNGKFDALDVLCLIEQERVKTWGSVPTMVSRVIQHERFKDFDTTSLSSVQMGGAAVPHDLRAQVQSAFPNTKKRVGTMYGLTEVGGVLAAGSGRDLEGRPGCVGKPLPSVEIEIRNPNTDGVGEIAARAPTATDGYVGDSAPLADKEGWILTGDLGKFDDAGFLYIVGRSKDTIIRGGENIASVHVESCLREHSQVLEAAVVPLPHKDLGEEVAAAVVLRPGANVTEDELRAHAAARLARFEVPSRWWLMQTPLPTNASGKVIKREVIVNWPQTAESNIEG